MIKRFLSIRPTIFAGVLSIVVLSLAACSPVAIMVPEAGVIDQAALPYVPSTRSSLESAAVEAAASPALLMAAHDAQLGDFLVDSRGMTLYMFAKDEAGKINCTGSCLQTWPPLLAMGNLVAGEGVDASLIGKTSLPGGLAVLTYNGMPLYTYAGDNNPGAINGQGKNDAWFVVSPDGNAVGK